MKQKIIILWYYCEFSGK